MTTKKTKRGDAGDLRRKAEEVQRQRPAAFDAAARDETKHLIHELQVHQIELDMQNEELRGKQLDIEKVSAKYFDLYDLAPVGYVTLSEHGLIIEANLTAANLLGVERSRLIMQPLSRFIVRDDEDIYYLHRKRCLETAGAQVCEFRMLHGETGPFWVRLVTSEAQDASGAPICRTVISDISERKLFEDAQLFLLQCGYVRAGEDFFASLARYLAEGLEMDYVCIDRLDGDGLTAQTVAVYYDGAFQDNVEYTLKDTPCADAVGKTICCFPKDVRHLFPRDVVLQEMVAESYVGTTLWSYTGNPIGLIALIGRKPLANPHMAESLLTLVAVRAAGELERKQAEEALRETDVELKRSNKDLEQFAFVASHDLQEPLRQITGFVELLERDYEPLFDETAKEYFDFVKQGGLRMQSLIRDLLEYSRVGRAGTLLYDLDPNEAARKAMIHLEARIEECGAEIAIEDLPLVQGNKTLLVQVFQNLIDNALKFRSERRLEIRIGARNQDGQWLFWVKDNGIGFPQASAERIFMVFQRLHGRDAYGGTGIGLAICKRAIERQRGRIWAESAPGEGSSFYFTLPAD